MNTALREPQNGRSALLQSFSSAYEPFSDTVSNTISVCGAQVVWEMFEKKFQKSFEADTQTLADQVGAWVASDLSFCDAFSVPVGGMKTSLRSSCKTEGRAELINLALHLVEQNRTLDWTGSVEGITGLFCSGQSIPAGKNLRTAALDGHIKLFVDEQKVIDSHCAVPRPNEVPFEVMDVEVAAQQFRDVVPDISKASCQDINEALTAALDLLSELPDFQRWVLRMTRNFVPLRVRDDTHLSRSFSHRPGLICASCPTSPTMLAELLVHEATHQYFYMLGGFSPFENGSDKIGYFSPVKGCKRPIFNILLAYHAFGNILMFHRALLDKGIAKEKAFSTDRVKQIEGYMPQFEEALETSPALTETGNALWQPLAERCAPTEFAHAML